MFRPTGAVLFIEKVAAPTVNDDQNNGYLVGDIWLDETNDKAYILLDATAGAAVWTEVTGAGGGVTDHGALTGLLDDDHTQYIKDSEFAADSEVLVGTGVGTFQKESGATLRTSLGVDAAGTLSALATKDPPIDADKTIYRDSTASDALVTSTWTQVKAFLKTYFDTLYNKYVHPNHSGDVTSVADGAQTIANKQTLAATAPITLSNTPTVVAAAAPVIAIPAATNAIPGHATAAHIQAIEANTGKETNVSTNLSEGTATETTVDVNSSDGSNATLASASTLRAGLLSKAKFDEIVANTAAKHTQGSDTDLDATFEATFVKKVDTVNVLSDITSAGADIEDAVIKKHTQGSDTALGAVATKDPPIDADKALYRDSTSSDALVTSTWTQVKAFLKTYFDTLYQAVNTATKIIAGDTSVEVEDVVGTATVKCNNVNVGDFAQSGLRLGNTGARITDFADEDDMSSNSDVKVPTQQSVKAYIDAQAGRSYVKVSDVKTSGTAGGTFTQAAWRTRTLNTEDSDPDAICALSSDQITLTAGTYECRIISTAHRVGNHKLRLQNVTGASTVLLGMNSYANNAADYAENFNHVVGRFTITASQALEVQHYCQTTQANNGFGGACTIAGVSDVYTIAEFWKVG